MLDLLDLSVKKLKAEIAELSDIIKIEKDSTEENWETIPINDLLDEVKLSIQEMLIKSNAKVTVDFRVFGVPFSKKNLRSIVLNLLTNAIKYKSPERDPEIHIGTEKSGNFIVLSIEDNGQGISKKNQSELFSKYKRVHTEKDIDCLLYTSPSPRDGLLSRMPSSA